MRTANAERLETLWTWRTAAILAVILALFLLALRGMGRIPLCTCGFGIWSGAWESSTSQHVIDPYSASHVLHGIIFYGALWFLRKKLTLSQRLIIAVLIEVAWELFENTPFVINRYRTATASLDYFGDSILNSTFDVLWSMLGFWFAARFPWQASLLAFIAIELILLLTIRDNLTLNVLMLLVPVDAIKTWQTGGFSVTLPFRAVLFPPA